MNRTLIFPGHSGAWGEGVQDRETVATYAVQANWPHSEGTTVFGLKRELDLVGCVAFGVRGPSKNVPSLRKLLIDMSCAVAPAPVLTPRVLRFPRGGSRDDRFWID